MNKLTQRLHNLILSAVACLLAISISTFSQPAQSQPVSAIVPQISPAQSTVIHQATIHQATSHQATIAQGMEDMPSNRYVAVLTPNEIVPMAPSTSATGEVEAMLMGNRFVVRGNFINLSSPLRDYATDPLDPPNPNITSGVHIHRGESTENGPFQYALQLSPDESGLQGQFMGEYTLTSEQRQALVNGKLYMDIHTRQNRAGELRGVFKLSQ
jgi:CHRD domain